MLHKTLVLLVPMALMAVAPAAADEPDPEDLKNTIRWTTASEVDNFGFDVMRGDSAEGPFSAINPQTIEGQGTTDEPTDYTFEDREIDPCRSYFYFVESISMTGEREHFTPVGQAKAKLPADDERCAKSKETGEDVAEEGS